MGRRLLHRRRCWLLRRCNYWSAGCCGSSAAAKLQLLVCWLLRVVGCCAAAAAGRYAAAATGCWKMGVCGSVCRGGKGGVESNLVAAEVTAELVVLLVVAGYVATSYKGKYLMLTHQIFAGEHGRN